MIQVVYNPAKKKTEELEILKGKKYLKYLESSYVCVAEQNLCLNLFRANTNLVVLEMSKAEQRISLQESLRKILHYRSTCDFVLVFEDESYESFLDSEMEFYEEVGKEIEKVIGF